MYALLILLVPSSGCGVLELDQAGLCIHKEMWPPHSIEISAYALVFAICTLANATGVGGGGLLVPLLVMLLNFPAHQAIPLSKSIILGGAIVSVLMSLRMPKVLIDFRIVSIMQPVVLMGTTIGVSLNRVFPEWLIILMLTATMGIVIYKNSFKAISLFKQESMRFQEIQRSVPEYYEKEIEKLSETHVNEDLQTGEEEDRVPWMNVAMIVITHAGTLLFALLKGGTGMESIIGLQQCSLDYWLLFCTYVGYCVFAAWIGHNLSQRYLLWDSRRYCTVITVSLLGGIGSGLLGLGGGVVISPLLLDLGLGPEATAASSSLIVLFTSSSTSLQFFLGNVLDLQYAAVMFVISMLASLVGIRFIGSIIKKYKRPSIIVFLLAAISAVSAMMLPLYAYIQLEGKDSFQSLC